MTVGHLNISHSVVLIFLIYTSFIGLWIANNISILWLSTLLIPLQKKVFIFTLMVNAFGFLFKTKIFPLLEDCLVFFFTLLKASPLWFKINLELMFLNCRKEFYFILTWISSYPFMIYWSLDSLVSSLSEGSMSCICVFVSGIFALFHQYIFSFSVNTILF